MVVWQGGRGDPSPYADTAIMIMKPPNRHTIPRIRFAWFHVAAFF